MYSKPKQVGISIKKFTFNPFQENTYIIHDDESCVIIDPGCYETHEKDALSSYISENDLTPMALLLTHAHIDHILGCSFILSKYAVDFYMHELDMETLRSVSGYAHLYGFPGYAPPTEPNKFLEDGQKLSFGKIEFDVRFTPGHAPGHVVFYNKESNSVINGDVLFQGSFGRVDLPGGDLATLKESIHTIMFELPEDTIVYCGHGPETTIGAEKRSNYILQH